MKDLLMVHRCSLGAALAVMMVTACASPVPTDRLAFAGSISQPDSANLLTLITSPDPETQFMALTLTRSAKAAGASPRILLCSAGGDLALGNPPAPAITPLKPSGLTPQDLLKTLIADGVQSDVCAIYLPNRPIGPDALIDGVGVAKPDDIGRLLANPGLRLFSF